MSVRARPLQPSEPDPDLVALASSFCAGLPHPAEVFDGMGQCVARNGLVVASGAPPDADAQAAALALFSGGGSTELADRARLVPLHDASGRLALVAVLYLGSDDQSAALSRERESRLTAEAASRMKDEFLALVSHELRTPLNSVVGWASMLKAGNVPPARMQKALDSIERNALVQARLVDDLLDVSRIMSGKLELNVAQHDLNGIVQNAADVVRRQAEEKGQRLEVTLTPERLVASCDAERLQQVAWNLISNAVKFTPGGGHIVVSTARVDGHAELRVQDDGKGIEPEFLPYLFERFRQADQSSTRRHGGLGLGLALAKHLVELHQGTVSADSPGEGKGSTFTVRIPLA